MIRICIVAIALAAAGASISYAQTDAVSDAGELPAADDPGPDPSDALGGILDAVRAGRWVVAIGGVLWILVYALRAQRLRRWIPWLGTRSGGYVIAFGLPVIAALAAGMYDDGTVSIDLILAALGTGFVASGLHGAKKDVRP